MSANDFLKWASETKWGAEQAEERPSAWQRTVMIDSLEREDFEHLRGVRGRCVSLYMPCCEDRDGLWDSRLTLAKLIASAFGKLLACGISAEEAKHTLSPATSLRDDFEFWKKPAAGIAILLGDGEVKTCRLPEAPPQLAIVATRFHLRPLLVGIEQWEANVLALDCGTTRLVRVLGDAAREVHVPSLPTCPDAFAEPDFSVRRVGVRVANARSSGMTTTSQEMYLNNNFRDDRFCRAVDRAVVRFLGLSRAPLILAASDSIASCYGNVNRYEELADETIPCSESNDQLAAAAKKVLVALERDRKAQIRQRFTEEKPRGLTREGIQNVLPAARAGRVEVLVADPRRLCWGTLNPDGSAEALSESSRGAEDLVNIAALETLAKGGRVVEFEQAAGQPEVYALLRY